MWHVVVVERDLKAGCCEGRSVTVLMLMTPLLWSALGWTSYEIEIWKAMAYIKAKQMAG